MREEMLQYAEPWIDEDDIKEVTGVLHKGHIAALPKVKEFETKFAIYVNAKYAVAFSNGTAALHACAFAAGIRQGDEVITTPMTFAASANCVLYCGGKPVFADVQKDTYNIDPGSIKKRITKKTKALIPVHFTGQPVDLDAIHEIADDYNLTVIEDAAHAIGATYKGRKIGSLSPMNVFSFHPVKQITTGEGGMVTTNEKDIYETLQQFRIHGITRDPEKLKKKDREEGGWISDQQFLGYNYKFTDVQAALGVAQLRKLEKFLAIRRRYASIYNEALKEMNEVITPYQLPDGCSAWHLYILQLNTKKIRKTRKQIYDELRQRYNIGVSVHYRPVYYHSYYQSLGYKRGPCPVAEELYENIITLPLFPKMTEMDVQYVIDGVKRVCTS